MIKETIKNMIPAYKITKKDIFDISVLILVFLAAAHLETL